MFRGRKRRRSDRVVRMVHVCSSGMYQTCVYVWCIFLLTILGVWFRVWRADFSAGAVLVSHSSLVVVEACDPLPRAFDVL